MQRRVSHILPKAQWSAKKFSCTRDRQKQVRWGFSVREAMAFVVVTSLVLLSSLLAILLTQSAAVARDFSSQTVNPRQSYPGIRMQQGNPQLDNDRKRDFGGSSVKIESRKGSVNMQQGKILRDNDWVESEKRGKNSTIFCGSNCRK
jgi:hypothetical protein